jgi:predicted sugar kinase
MEQAENPIYFTQDVEEFINENYEELILAILKQPVLACQSSLGSAIYNICRPR